MKPLMLGLGAAALCSAAVLAAPQTPVALTGCVHAGAAPDTYVLLDVDEVTDGHPVPAGAVYWLSSTKGITSHVGHKVEVRGTYSIARDSVATARLKGKTGPIRDRQTIAFESGARNVGFKEELRAVGTTGVLPAKVKRPYRQLDVKRVRMIGASCDVP